MLMMKRVYLLIIIQGISETLGRILEDTNKEIRNIKVKHSKINRTL